MSSGSPSIALLRLDDAEDNALSSMLERFGNSVVSFNPSDDLPNKTQALCVFGDGAFGSNGEPAPIAIHQALEARMPILAIEAGMHALNIALGGGAPIAVENHSEIDKRRIFLALGSKLAETIGGAGFASPSCSHRYGLTLPQQAPRTLVGAYSADDGVVESFEAIDHSWVLGVQWRAHRLDEQPSGFDNLFHALIGKARSP